MNAAASLPVDTDTLFALFSHLRDTASELSLADATSLADPRLARSRFAPGQRIANAAIRIRTRLPMERTVPA